MDARRFITALIIAASLPGAYARAAVPASVTPKKAVVIAADKWCPVNCQATNGPPGYAVELARESLALAGWTVEYRIMPWDRARDAARAGRIDGIIGTIADEAPDFVFPRETIGRNANVFFVRKDSAWRYRGLRSLDKVIVGVVNEYRFGTEFDTYVARYQDDPKRIARIYSLEPVPQGLRMLQAGRIDAYIDDRMVVNWAMKQDPALASVRESGKLGETSLYIAFSPAKPQSRAVADAFDRGVRQLRADGKLAAILARYGVSDWGTFDVQP